ncbi:hypothetical protein EMQ25_11090 [Arsenicitalea aurantiaca]|uniref:Apea-like HEPN domain-containing protein n=1 Tax=Arsenicitalea aurantiaca TaxID=1783274 RepID=A0A433XBB7_9HYPH|nr:hypothetical protein [Arsenicitalea aurantiaca]RUT31387.1 hypothetical protein EMQ25_11090 [Arsenicitalea aurantiaca]
MVENWIRTDEVEDVAGSIRHVIRAAQFAAEDPLAWKWVVIALDSALQGACVCHLTTTAAPIGAVTKRNASEWWTYLGGLRSNPNARQPKTELMGLPDLLKAVRKPGSAGNGSNSAGIAISDSELNWLLRFHKEIRNQFAHFGPAGWSIEVSGIPKIARLVARIIRDILEAGWAFRHQDCAAREEMQQSLHAVEMIKWPT